MSTRCYKNFNRNESMKKIEVWLEYIIIKVHIRFTFCRCWKDLIKELILTWRFQSNCQADLMLWLCGSISIWFRTSPLRPTRPPQTAGNKQYFLWYPPTHPALMQVTMCACNFVFSGGGGVGQWLWFFVKGEGGFWKEGVYKL